MLSYKFGEERDLNKLVKDAETKDFTVDFLTKFLLKGYSKENRVDLTGVSLATEDKNNLKVLGVATEDIERIAEEQREKDAREAGGGTELSKGTNL